MEPDTLDTLATVIEDPIVTMTQFQELLTAIIGGLLIPILIKLKPVIAKIPGLTPITVVYVLAFAAVFGLRWLVMPEMEGQMALTLAMGAAGGSGILYSTVKKILGRNKEANGTG